MQAVRVGQGACRSVQGETGPAQEVWECESQAATAGVPGKNPDLVRLRKKNIHTQSGPIVLTHLQFSAHADKQSCDLVIPGHAWVSWASVWPCLVTIET